MRCRGLILAAGRGSRMGSLTNNSHKCLTIIENKTLLDWQVSSMNNAGIQEINVVVGYNSEKIEGRFLKIKNDKWATTNMVGSLFCAPRFNCDTVVSYSDIVYSPKHVKSLIKKRGDVVITADKLWFKLWSKRFVDPLDDAESFKTIGDNLLEIGNKVKTIENIEAQYMGLIKFSKKGWEVAFNLFNSLNIKEQGSIDMTTFLNKLLEYTEIKTVFVNGGWCEVDTYNDLKTYKKILSTNKNWTHDWRK